MAQQTAIDYLIEQLIPKALASEQYYHIEVAKEMEREQIMMAFNDGKVNAVLNKRNSSQYYTETYNK